MPTVAKAADYLLRTATDKKRKKLSSAKAVAAAQALADQGHDMPAEHAELITAVYLAWGKNRTPEPSVWDDSSSCQGPKALGVAFQHLDTAALRFLDADDVIMLAWASTSYVDGELEWLRNGEDRDFHTMVVESYRGVARVYADDSLWDRVAEERGRSMRERRSAMESETLTNLSVALVMAWERYGDSDAPVAAVTVSRRAVDLDESLAARHALGRAGWAAYQVTGDPSYLAEAVQVLRPLAAATPLSHPSGPTVSDSLLVCLGTLALDTRDSAALDEALALGERLLSAAQHSSPQAFWELRAHLVPVLVAQSQRDQEPAPLARALTLAEEAVRAARADLSGVDEDGPRPIPTHPVADVALAQVYLARAQATGLPDDARAAVVAAQTAADVCTAVWRSLAQYTTDLLGAAGELVPPQV